MNKTSALRPLGALAASTLLLLTVVMAASAQEVPLQPVAATVSPAVGCQSRLPDNPTTGLNLGPLFQLAVKHGAR